MLGLMIIQKLVFAIKYKINLDQIPPNDTITGLRGDKSYDTFARTVRRKVFGAIQESEEYRRRWNHQLCEL